MGKQFKLRFSRVIPLFQSCRSKDPSNLPENPIPSYFRLSPANPKSIIDSQFPVVTKIPISPSPLKSHHNHQNPSLKRQVSSAIVSIGCGRKSKSNNTHEATTTTSITTEFQWKKEEKWHVVAKIQDDNDNFNPRRKIYASSSVSGDSEDGGLYSSSELFNRIEQKKNYKKQKNKKKKKKRQQQHQRILSRLSTSSAESGWFSSGRGENNDDEQDEEDEETETLVSSFSNDSSSEFGTLQLATIRESPPPPSHTDSKPSDTDSKPKNKKHRVRSRVKRFASKRKNGFGFGFGLDNVDQYGSPETESPARLSVFSRLVPACKVEGKVKESFAIVKKSEDPYMDFRRSMLEMIMEKQMFEAKDLEQLLHCFLSLNSKSHHPVIVKVFSEIWEFLFCTTSSSSPLHEGKNEKELVID